jgi:hypothetical protein
MISIRNNAFVNVSFNKYGLLTATKNEYINTRIFIENNYFESIASDDIRDQDNISVEYIEKLRIEKMANISRQQDSQIFMFQNLHLPNDYNDYQQIDYLAVNNNSESSINES